MSAFRDLLAEAHAKGVRFLTFDVDLKDFFANEQNEAWRCESREADGELVIPSAQGRTGEEALREFMRGVDWRNSQ